MTEGFRVSFEFQKKLESLVYLTKLLRLKTACIKTPNIIWSRKKIWKHF